MTPEEIVARFERIERALLALIELCELPKLAELSLYGPIWQAAVELEQFQKAISGNGKQHAA